MLWDLVSRGGVCFSLVGVKGVIYVEFLFWGRFHLVCCCWLLCFLQNGGF